MPTIIRIPIGTSTRFLALRSTGSVVIADQKLKDEYQEPQILASSPAGCMALSDAFRDMAEAMRQRKKEGK